MFLLFCCFKVAFYFSQSALKSRLKFHRKSCDVFFFFLFFAANLTRLIKFYKYPQFFLFKTCQTCQAARDPERDKTG